MRKRDIDRDILKILGLNNKLIKTFENTRIFSEERHEDEKKYNKYLNEIYNENPITKTVEIKAIKNNKEPLEDSYYLRDRIHKQKHSNNPLRDRHIDNRMETYENSHYLRDRVHRPIKSKKNILKEIKNKIIENIKKNNNIEDNLLAKYLSFNFNVYNDKYTRKIVKNYVNDINRKKILDQIYYNYILSGTVNICIELLRNPDIDINNALDHLTITKQIKNKNLHNIRHRINQLYDIENSNSTIHNEFNNLLYIFFYVIPYSRRIIEVVKKKIKASSYGEIDFKLNRTHRFNMERFINYKRLNIILNNINDDNMTLSISDVSIMNEINRNGLVSELEYCYSHGIIFNRDNISDICPRTIDYKILDNTKINFKKYIINLDIPINFFNSEYLIGIYQELIRSSNMFIQYFTYDNEPKRLEYFVQKNESYNKNKKFNDNIDNHRTKSSCFNNNIQYIDNFSRILIILSYCLHLLKYEYIRNDILHNIENDMDKIKKIIIIFYYLFIYLMMFNLGTASIAEISLFTLWDTYVNNDLQQPLIINQNIMIDVEVLSMPFSKFYINCFNKEYEGDIYTPYFINL